MNVSILVTVSAVALCCASAASAQSTLPYYAVSTTQASADVAASVDQTGDNNNASITQGHANGAQNSGVIVQGFDGVNANGSTASVAQSGNGQRAVALQVNGNGSATSQSGANNDAFTYQSGAANNASTTQTQTSSPSHTGNIAGVNGAGSVSGGDTLASSLTNQGEAQIEGAVEAGINSPTDLNNESASYIVQASGAAANRATVNQSAAGERAAIVQISSETGSTAAVTQTGVNSDGFIHQDSGGYNSAGISQSGSYQSAAIYQTASVGSGASISQTNNGNIGFAVQSGTAQQSFTTQDGVQDQARTTQSGGYNYSNLYQTVSSSNGFATVAQNGSGNQSFLTQTANADVADVTQFGAGNVSSVSQDISNGWAHAYQNGTMNSSNISQHN